MKVGDLVTFRNRGVRFGAPSLGFVVEVDGVRGRRVKWFHLSRPTWYSKKYLEIVNEDR